MSLASSNLESPVRSHVLDASPEMLSVLFASRSSSPGKEIAQMVCPHSARDAQRSDVDGPAIHVSASLFHRGVGGLSDDDDADVGSFLQLHPAFMAHRRMSHGSPGFITFSSHIEGGAMHNSDNAHMASKASPTFPRSVLFCSEGHRMVPRRSLNVDKPYCYWCGGLLDAQRSANKKRRRVALSESTGKRKAQKGTPCQWCRTCAEALCQDCVQEILNDPLVGLRGDLVPPSSLPCAV